MNTKSLLAALAAGVVFFLLGGLIYGLLLADYMEANSNPAVAKLPMEMWAMIVSNFIWGILLVVIFEWSNTRNYKSGFIRGFIIGLLTALAFDFSLYSMLTIVPNLTVVFVDSISLAVLAGFAGLVAALILGRNMNTANNS